MITIVLAVLGLCLGSFVNALVWRLHQQTKPSKSSGKELSIVTGHSMCPHCRHRLAAKDLVPVFSWLALKGRCRYCKRPISWQYPMVELIMSLLFVLSYWQWPLGWSASGIVQFCVWLVVLTGLMALAVYDYRWMELPSRIIYPLTTLVSATLVVEVFWQSEWSLMLGAVLGAVCLAGLFLVLYVVSKGRWIGFGDVRLGVLLGLLVGSPAKATLVLLFGSFFGTVYAIPSLLSGKRNMSQRVPFGPFLIAAAVVVVLFGSAIINWYYRLFLPQ